MTPKHEQYFTLFFYYFVAWCLVVGVFLLVRYYDINEPLGIIDEHFSWGKQLSETFIVVLLASSISTVLDPLLGSRRWKKLPLTASILGKCAIYIVFVFCFFSTQTLLEKLTESSWDMTRAGEGYIQAITGRRFQMVMIYLSLGFLAVQGIRHGKRLLGYHAFRQYFTGRYLRPRIEERYLLFTDMENSTTIAERLGPVLFSSYMQDVYYDLDEPISRWGGNVYQYVGDEIIVTWTPEKAKGGWICVHCFFAMEYALLQRAGYYFKTYGEMPVFRAGLHAGEIVAAVIGRFKSELAMHGDAMNTASRIAVLAKQHRESLLVSATALDEPHDRNEISVATIGETSVRGKEHPVKLLAVRRTGLSQETPGHE